MDIFRGDEKVKVIKWAAKTVLKAIIILIVIQMIRAYTYVKNDLELKPWHSKSSKAEMSYDNYDNLEDYLKAEKIYLEEMYAEVAEKEESLYNRYAPGSQSSPYGYFENNVNASYEMVPEEIRGGVLMLHGLTDGPYSMADMAKIYYDKGYYVLVMRYPYHGTHPGETLKLDWKDFSDTAKFGARMVQKKLEENGGGRFYIAGYSTGATAALRYITHDMQKDDELPEPDGVFWFSPAMGVNPTAKFGFLDILASKVPGFSKFAWLDIYPEYDMAKYNSFTKNAGIQVYNLIERSKKSLGKLSREEKSKLPPIYSYTSIEDATVDATESFKIITDIGNEEGEIIIFDANRKYNHFFKKRAQKTGYSERIKESGILTDVVIISNYRNRESNEVEVIRFSKGTETLLIPEEKLEWMDFTFSLAHVSLPISPDNPIYGRNSLMGNLNIKGEKGIVSLPTDMFIRLRYNEFFSYMKENIEEKID